MDSRFGRGGHASVGNAWDQSAGFEESMMRMGVRGAETYPQRHGVADCDHYIRTGYCSFSSRCRFNHPLDRSRAVSAMRFEGGEYPERPGEHECQFYMKTGICKFGISCKFHHPKNEGGSSTQVPLNGIGYPLRPVKSIKFKSILEYPRRTKGGTDCSYYLKTGQCKFGMSCKFHHPQPAAMSGSGSSSAPAFYPQSASSVATLEQYSESSTHWKVDRSRTVLPGSYVQGSYGPMLVSHGLLPVPASWTPYSGSVTAVPSTGVESLPYLHMLPPNATSSSSRFPERHGEPECQYYLRTRDCKYGSSCKYHHPKQWNMPNTNYELSPLGLPLRPGVQPCGFYIQTGYCKFGSTCKFDHPVDTRGYNSIPLSQTNVSISQHQMQSTTAALAPFSI